MIRPITREGWPISMRVETFGAREMDLYATWCGRALALGHARSGSSNILSGYMGKSDVFDHALAHRDRNRPVGELGAQLVVALERAREAEELLLGVAEEALRLRDLEDRVGVRLDAVGRHDQLLPTESM